MNVDLVQQVLAALERERVDYVVFGAVALALHGLPRATEDLDLFVAPDRDNIDILTRFGESFDVASLTSERVDFGGVAVSVVTPETLFRMKRGTVRPKDHVDAERIARRFGIKAE